MNNLSGNYNFCHTGYGRREVVEFLLAAGASIQARDDGGLHPLHNACSFGHADVVRIIILFVYLSSMYHTVLFICLFIYSFVN
jgi:ankyrin repeat protein